MKLFVGLVTYGEYSLKYLEQSLAALTSALDFLAPDNFVVGIFDNSEAGDTRNQDFVSRHYPDFLLISRGENLGFAKAYNILLNRAQEKGAKYFFMMNPDILLEKETIAKLVCQLDDRGELASVCPKLYRWPFPDKPQAKILDTCGLILLPGLRFVDLGQGKEDDGSFDSQPILGPSGAAGLFRLSFLERIAFEAGGEKQYFDERMFMYKEDCDLAYRLFLAGGQSLCVADALAWHDRSAADPGRGFFAALKDRKNKSKQVRRWSFVNQHLIFAKYFAKQNFSSKLKVVSSVLAMLAFSVVKEPFLLPEYRNILSKISKNN